MGTYIYIYICIYIYANGDTVWTHFNIPSIYSHASYSQGSQNRRPFGSRSLTAIVRENKCHATARLCHTLTVVPTTSYQLLQDRREAAIHRLSAVGLPRSLRTGNCGPHNQWLKKTVAITHSHLPDMPPHQLPARSQILHRVSILVEAKPQNWDLAHPDDLWLPREGD